MRWLGSCRVTQFCIKCRGRRKGAAVIALCGWFDCHVHLSIMNHVQTGRGRWTRDESANLYRNIEDSIAQIRLQAKHVRFASIASSLMSHHVHRHGGLLPARIECVMLQRNLGVNRYRTGQKEVSQSRMFVWEKFVCSLMCLMLARGGNMCTRALSDLSINEYTICEYNRICRVPQPSPNRSPCICNGDHSSDWLARACSYAASMLGKLRAYNHLKISKPSVTVMLCPDLHRSKSQFPPASRACCDAVTAHLHGHHYCPTFTSRPREYLRITVN